MEKQKKFSEIKKPKQMDLPFPESKISEEKEPEEYQNWGPGFFPTGEKINPNDYHSDEIDITIKLKDGKWLVNYEEKTFEEAIKAMGNGLSIALREKEFKKIYDYFMKKQSK